MHYLIIAVLTFGLSLMGCEGKTGPAGPTGPAGSAGPAGPAGPQGSTGPAGPTGADGADGAQGPAGPAGPAGADGAQGPAGPAGADGADGAQGPAGADGADGAQGPAGPAGPEGPPGPAGIPDTGGIDPIQLAQAHHIAIKVGDGDKENATGGVSTIMRVGEDVMIVAAARAQSEKVLDGIPVALTITKNADEAITLEDGMITAVGAGSAEITAVSELAGISGKLTVMVTKPIDKIVFDPDDSDYSLAAGESTGEITATAQDEDGNDITPRSAWSWSSDAPGVATVAKVMEENADGDMVVKGIGQHAMITGAGTGSTDIMATAEGVSGSISVSVTGQRITRYIDPSSSNNDNHFVWDRGREVDGTVTPGWTTPDAGAADATTEFEVNLRDIVTENLIDVWSLGVTPATPVAGTAAAGTTAQVDPKVGAVSSDNGSATAATGALTVTVTANAVPSGITAGTYETFVSLTSTGAREARLRFTITVKDAPPAE